MIATASLLTLSIESHGQAAMETLKALVTRRVATISRRDKLDITWQPLD